MLDERYFLMVFLTEGSPLVILGGQNTLKTISIVFFFINEMNNSLYFVNYIYSLIFCILRGLHGTTQCSS